MICLGIESTAHTFGVGIVDDNKILSNARDIYVPAKGGIHPIEAKNHHITVSEVVLQKALDDAKLTLNDIDIFAYSAGPGLPPCLLAGAEFVKKIAGKKPIIATNHCVAHIEIGRLLCKANDPITLYVSGGNTQVIGYAENKYRIFGETQDIGIGNAIDKFIRETSNTFPGGPVMQKLAQESNKKYIELPYVVKGMDLSFSGIVTSAIQKYKKIQYTEPRPKCEAFLRDMCYSFQETCYAMLTEVTERALAHTGKKEVLLTGGVAASQRLQEMLNIMCSERKMTDAHGASIDTTFYVCPREFAGDCGANIAFTGYLMYASGYKPLNKSNVNIKTKWRTDVVDVTWL